MAEINDLSSISSLSSADQIPIWATAEGVTQKISVNQLVEYLIEQMNVFDGFESQYAAPSASSFSVSITDGSQNTHLILTPVAGYAAGTIVLPAIGNCVDGQQILVNCTQAVTTLTITGNGATVTGAPTTLAANAYFRLKFDAVLSTWYRVG